MSPLDMTFSITDVLATVDFDAPARRRLSALFAPAQVHFVQHSDRAAVERLLPSCQVAVLGELPSAAILAADTLRWIHVDMSGLDRIARPETVDSPRFLTSSAGRSAPALAEHAVFFMLALVYRAQALETARRRRVWGVRGYASLRALHGRRVLIVGFGHTGQALAPICAAHGMEVSVFTRSAPTAAPPGVHIRSLAAGDDLRAACHGADVVALAASLNNTSFRMLRAEHLACLRRGALLVNVARADLVCPDAFRAALASGQLAGAGLDVAYEEPMPPWDPLWRHRNVAITPHVTPHLSNRTDRTLDIVEENLRRLASGEPLLNRLGPADVFTPPAPQPSKLPLGWLARRETRRLASLWRRLAMPRAD